MLILARRIGEIIHISNDITITILGIKGNQVRLGIEAPKNMMVNREEIYNRIQAEKREKQKESEEQEEVSGGKNEV